MPAAIISAQRVKARLLVCLTKPVKLNVRRNNERYICIRIQAVMLTIIALGVIFTLAVGLKMNGLLWLTVSLSIALVINSVVYLCGGPFAGGSLALIPIAIFMIIVHRTVTGKSVVQEYREQYQEAEEKAEEVRSQQYPSDLTVLTTYIDQAHQQEFISLRNALDEAGIMSWVRSGGVTNLLVREVDFDKAQAIAERVCP